MSTRNTLASWQKIHSGPLRSAIALTLLGCGFIACYAARATQAQPPAAPSARAMPRREFTDLGHFTHRCKRDTAYYRSLPADHATPVGTLKAGSLVHAVLQGGRARIWIVAEVDPGELEPILSPAASPNTDKDR